MAKYRKARSETALEFAIDAHKKEFIGEMTMVLESQLEHFSSRCQQALLEELQASESDADERTAQSIAQYKGAADKSEQFLQQISLQLLDILRQRDAIIPMAIEGRLSALRDEIEQALQDSEIERKNS